MSYANAALTPKARLKLARLVVDQGWPTARVAERLQVSWPTAKRWVDRYRQFGPAGMQDRSSRPQRQPTRTPQRLVRKIVHVRWKRRLGPVGIASVPGLPASTVHAVLRRCGISRLSQVHRATGEPVRRYEHEHPGDLLHMDVKKLGNIPDGGGWRFVGKQRLHSPAADSRQAAQQAPRRADAARVRPHHHRRPQPRPYAEIHDDETAVTAAGVLRRAVVWFAARGVVVQWVLTDNGGC